MVAVNRKTEVNMPGRQFVGVKIGPNGVAWLDMVALEEDGRQTERTITRSDVIRAALVVASRHDKELRLVLRGES